MRPHGLPTKVQFIQRKTSRQWSVNFPSVLAQALEFSRGETVECPRLQYSSLSVFARPGAGRRKSVVEMVERGSSRVFLLPCRGLAESAIAPTVPPYGCTVGYLILRRRATGPALTNEYWG